MHRDDSFYTLEDTPAVDEHSWEYWENSAPTQNDHCQRQPSALPGDELGKEVISIFRAKLEEGQNSFHQGKIETLMFFFL